jgi:hypothetical protein
MAEIIHYVPMEIIIKYFNALPIKSAIKFGSCSKALHAMTEQLVEKREKETLSAILNNIIQTMKQFHQDMTSVEARNGMLSFMLRRMIHTSAIYETDDDAENLFPHYPKYHDEYNNIFLQVNEEIDMDIKEFNTYMENAQFEYRGFSIIGLPAIQRQKLDVFKHVLETRYYSECFKIQTYLAYDNNTFIEMIFDGETVEFDFHMRRVEDGQWIFIDQEISRFNITLQHVRNINRMLCFHYLNHVAVEELVELLFELFNSSVKGVLVKGSEQTNISIWNNFYEENAVLAEAIHCYTSDYSIELKLHDITHHARIEIDL